MNILTQYAEMVTQLESPGYTIEMAIKKDVAAARLLHAVLGCASEAGELTDQIKKHLVYGAPLDTVNVQEELGDLLWYIQLACNVMQIHLEDLLKQNMAKLKARFGDKFDFDRVLNRDLDREREALEQNNPTQMTFESLR